MSEWVILLTQYTWTTPVSLTPIEIEPSFIFLLFLVGLVNGIDLAERKKRVLHFFQTRFTPQNQLKLFPDGRKVVVECYYKKAGATHHYSFSLVIDFPSSNLLASLKLSLQTYKTRESERGLGSENTEDYWWKGRCSLLILRKVSFLKCRTLNSKLFLASQREILTTLLQWKASILRLFEVCHFV